MTDTKQPEALRLADSLDANASGGNVTTMDEERAIAQTLRRLHAENEALASKLKVYEDLDEADSDVQLLRMGYAAARLKIESLNARIKGLIAERDAAYEVAMMNTESGAALAKAAQAAGEYPPLPWGSDFEEWLEVRSESAVHDAFRAYVDADRAMRAQAAPVAQGDAEDAARYQWLRLALADRTNNGKSHWFCSIAAGHPEELDSAIDAARSQAKEGGA